MVKNFIEKLYIVDSLEVAKYLINDCHFELIGAKAQEEGKHKIMFRFEDTPELRAAIKTYNIKVGFNRHNY